MGEPDEPPLSTNPTRSIARLFGRQRSVAQSKPVSRSHDPASEQASEKNVVNAKTKTDLDGTLEQSSSNSTGNPVKLPIDEEKAANQQGSTVVVENGQKPGKLQTFRTASARYLVYFLHAITRSWINVLLVFVPIGILVNFVPIPDNIQPTIVFAFNAVAIIPLAGLLAYATEAVANRMGDTLASLLNVTFGNAVELIIFIIALAKDEISIVQASILGSILANLLLILGMSFLFGGLRYREQVYNSTVTQMSAVLLSLSVTSLLLPTAFHASFANTAQADATTTKISRGTSVVLLIVYVLYLLFQLKSHAYIYESTPQEVIDEEARPGVLADMLQSSSSSESSSDSSSSDSDDSAGSHHTAKQRFKKFRKRMRRKSNAGSSINTSPQSASIMSSPEHDKRSVFDEAIPPNREDYFTQTDPQRQATASGAVLSGDEADTDGEHREMDSNVRDFGRERAGTFSSSHPSIHKKGGSHKAEKKPKKPSRKAKLRDKLYHDMMKREEAVAAAAAAAADAPASFGNPEPASYANAPTSSSEARNPRVGFADALPSYTEEREDNTPGNSSTSPRRNFVRQFSRPSFKPPQLPSLLSNTVFSTPAPPTNPTANPNTRQSAAALSIAHRMGRTSGLRRTSSLPDRLNRPDAGGRTASSTTRRDRGTPSGLAQSTNATEIGDTDTNFDDSANKSVSDDDSAAGGDMPRGVAVLLLLVTTGLVAFCAELLVEAIPDMVASTNVSQAFIGLIVLPIVGNAAEHVTAVTVASKNKMDLAIGIAVGSSIQIALFVTPFVVLLGWIMGKDMSLYFNIFETVSLFVTAFVVNFLVLDGRSNYLEGALLIAAYVIIAVAAYFYPAVSDESAVGGNSDIGVQAMVTTATQAAGAAVRMMFRA